MPYTVTRWLKRHLATSLTASSSNGVINPMKYGATLEHAHYDVPISVPHERVMEYADKYMRKAGNAFESMGYTVLDIESPRQVKYGKDPGDKDLKRYCIRAWCRKRPKDVIIRVPDEAVPSLLKQGMKLKE